MLAEGTDAGGADTVNFGNVAIGQSDNQNSLLRVAGPIRMGTETGSGQAPTTHLASCAGMITRRFVAASTPTGEIVARSEHITLESVDQSPAERSFRISWPAVAGPPVLGYFVNGVATTTLGTTVPINFTGSMSTAGSLEVVDPAERPIFIRLVFGEAGAGNNPQHFTEITATRSQTTATRWVGTLRAAWNQ